STFIVRREDCRLLRLLELRLLASRAMRLEFELRVRRWSAHEEVATPGTVRSKPGISLRRCCRLFRSGSFRRRFAGCSARALRSERTPRAFWTRTRLRQAGRAWGQTAFSNNPDRDRRQSPLCRRQPFPCRRL